jgi:hypothetical protein
VRQDPSVYPRLPGLGQGRSVYLLVSSLLLIAIEPWLTNVVGRGLWEVLFTLITLSSIHVLSVKRAQALIAGLLALPTLAACGCGNSFPRSV